MPIYGLTDQTPSFIEVGRLRKGDPKTEYSPGKDLTYFRPDFKKGNEHLLKRFVEIYGSEPDSINIRLGFSDVVSSWDAHEEVYLKGGRIAMGDGERWVYLRDYRTHEVLVKDGQLTEIGKRKEVSLEYDKKEPVYFYRSKRKKMDIPVFVKAYGRLRFIIPELGVLAYVMLITSSTNGIRNISSQLAGAHHIARITGKTLSQVPLLLVRKPAMVSVPLDSGGMVRMEKWLCNVQIRDDWASEAIYGLDSGVLPTPGLIPELSSGVDEGPTDSIEENEDAENDVVIIAGAALGDDEPIEARPYPPATVLKKIYAKAKKLDEKEQKPLAKNARGLVVKNLQLCFVGEKDFDERRKVVLDYLTLNRSIKPNVKDPVSDNEVRALDWWLDAKQDSGGAYSPYPLAAKEARAIYAHVVGGANGSEKNA